MLFKRLERLFKADVHGVLDSLEDPQAMLKFSMQEMEECLSNLENKVQRLEMEEKQLRKHQSELEEKNHRIEEDLDLCLQKKDEELIKRQIKKKLELEKVKGQRKQKLEDLASERDQVMEDLNLKREKLRDLKERAEFLQPISNPASEKEPSSWQVGEDEVEMAYLRLLQEKGVGKEIKV